MCVGICHVHSNRRNNWHTYAHYLYSNIVMHVYSSMLSIIPACKDFCIITCESMLGSYLEPISFIGDRKVGCMLFSEGQPIPREGHGTGINQQHDGHDAVCGLRLSREGVPVCHHLLPSQTPAPRTRPASTSIGCGLEPCCPLNQPGRFCLFCGSSSLGRSILMP